MNISNPLEIIITFALVIFSIWMVEKIITGAFKAIIIAVIIMLIFVGVSHYSGKRKATPLPSFAFSDLTNWEVFKKKTELYKKETIRDIKESFYGAEKNIKTK